MAIAGVGSGRGALSGPAHEGRTLLGGDAAFSLIQREATPDEVAYRAAADNCRWLRPLRAMVRSGNEVSHWSS